MVDYAEVPDTAKLYVESQQCMQGIELIDAGGTISSFVVVPPVLPPYDPNNPPPPQTKPLFAVNITLSGPAQPATVAQARVALVSRVHEIAAQLEAMGVEVPAPVKDVS